MIKVVPVTEQHFVDIDLNSSFSDEDHAISASIGAAKANPSATLLAENGVVVCICGVYRHYPGSWEVWTLMSKHVARYKKEVIKSLRSLISGYMKLLKMHRIQAVCPENMRGRDKWFRLLGLKYDAVLEKYGPNGENYCVYSRVS